MTDDKPTCNAEANFEDGSPNLLCVREPHRNPNHQAKDGTKFIRTPLGFWTKDPQG